MDVVVEHATLSREHVVITFFAQREFSVLCRDRLNGEVIIFTGDDESIQKEFSLTFSGTFCVWFIQHGIYMDALNRLEVVEANLKNLQKDVSKMQDQDAKIARLVNVLEAILLERAEYKMMYEDISAKNANLEGSLARVTLLEKKCKKLEKKLQKTEAKRSLAQKGLEDFMKRCSDIGSEFAEYKKTHP